VTLKIETAKKVFSWPFAVIPLGFSINFAPAENQSLGKFAFP
jgi:hypothetical protein